MAASMMTLTAAPTHLRLHQQVHPKALPRHSLHAYAALIPRLQRRTYIIGQSTRSYTDPTSLCVATQHHSLICLDQQANLVLCRLVFRSVCEAPICSLLRHVASGGDTPLLADPPHWGILSCPLSDVLMMLSRSRTRAPWSKQIGVKALPASPSHIPRAA